MIIKHINIGINILVKNNLLFKKIIINYNYMFSLCIPTIDRFDNFLSKNLPKYIENEFINEIIITDENGNDIDKIKKHIPNIDKLKLIKNDKILGPLFNKLKVCSFAKNEWIVLMDSDNFADINYFKIAKEYIENNIKEQKNVILAPSKANPNFNYSQYSGFIYKKGNFKLNNENEKKFRNNNVFSECLMNTGNYVINKYLIDNLDFTNELKLGHHLNSPYDVIYLNTLMFEQLDLNLFVVENLEYEHIIHNDSIFIKTQQQYKEFNLYIHNRYRNLN